MFIDANAVLTDLRAQAVTLTTATNNASLADARSEALKEARKQEGAAIDAAIQDVLKEIDRVNKDMERRDRKWLETREQCPIAVTELGKVLLAAPFKDLDALRDTVAEANKLPSAATTKLDGLNTGVIQKYDAETAGESVAPDEQQKVKNARKLLDEARGKLVAANKELAAFEAKAEGVRLRTGALLTVAEAATRDATRACVTGDATGALRRYLAARAAGEELTALAASMADIDNDRTTRRNALTAAMTAWVDALEAYVEERNKAVEVFADARARASAREQEIDRLLADAVRNLLLADPEPA